MKICIKFDLYWTHRQIAAISFKVGRISNDQTAINNNRERKLNPIPSRTVTDTCTYNGTVHLLLPKRQRAESTHTYFGYAHIANKRTHIDIEVCQNVNRVFSVVRLSASQRTRQSQRQVEPRGRFLLFDRRIISVQKWRRGIRRRHANPQTDKVMGYKRRESSVRTEAGPTGEFWFAFFRRKDANRCFRDIWNGSFRP